MDNDHSVLKAHRKRLETIYSEKPEFKELMAGVFESIDSIIDGTVHVTCGQYETENESERHFDSLINPDFFINEKEVVGRRLFDDKPIDENGVGQRVRIDRILIPTEKAVEMGWKQGAIGVEIKKSRIAIGGVYAQIFEYRQSIFRLSGKMGFLRVMPMVFAVFPSHNVLRDLHSLQSSQIIASCRYRPYDESLHFGTGSNGILDIFKDRIHVNKEWSPSVHKGHRGREK